MVIAKLSFCSDQNNLSPSHFCFVIQFPFFLLHLSIFILSYRAIFFWKLQNCFWNSTPPGHPWDAASPAVRVQGLGSWQAVIGGVQGEKPTANPSSFLPWGGGACTVRLRDAGFERAAEFSQGRWCWAAKLCNPSHFISTWKVTSAAPGELCWLRLPEGPGEFQLELAAAFLKLGCVLHIEAKFEAAEHYSVWVKHTLLRYTFKQWCVKSKQLVERESKEERWSRGKENPASLFLFCIFGRACIYTLKLSSCVTLG